MKLAPGSQCPHSQLTWGALMNVNLTSLTTSLMTEEWREKKLERNCRQYCVFSVVHVDGLLLFGLKTMHTDLWQIPAIYLWDWQGLISMCVCYVCVRLWNLNALLYQIMKFNSFTKCNNCSDVISTIINIYQLFSPFTRFLWSCDKRVIHTFLYEW